MFCTKCGSQIADGSAFCTSCGAPQAPVTPVEPAFEPAIAVEPAVPAPEPEDPSSAVTQLISTYEEPAQAAAETVVLDAADVAPAAETAVLAGAAETAVLAGEPAARPEAQAYSLPDSAFMPSTPEPYAPSYPEPAAGAPATTFCMTCGAQVPVGQAFCTQCGTPLGQVAAPAPAMPAATAVMPPAAQPYGQAPAYQGGGYQEPSPYEQQPAQKGGKKGLIIGIVAIIAALAVAAVVVLFVLPAVNGDSSSGAASSSSAAASKASSSSAAAEDDEEADDEDADEDADDEDENSDESASSASSSASSAAAADDEPVKISASISGSSYIASESTPVPVVIEGTTDDGEVISVVLGLTGNTSIDIYPGSYTAMVLASPLTASGMLFDVSGMSTSFVVESDGATALPNIDFALGDHAIAPIDVTDAQLSAAKSAARDQLGADADTIEAYAKATEDARSKAQEEQKAADEQKKKEEEERKKAEEEAKAREEATWYVCASDFVTLRSSPSTSATAIVRITSREPVTYISDAGGGWSEVEYNGSRGYVLTRFISKDKNAPLDYGDV